MTAHQTNAIAYIADQCGTWVGCNVREVGTRTADALERKGLVELRRETVWADRAYTVGHQTRTWNKVIARLTPKGRALAALTA